MGARNDAMVAGVPQGANSPFVAQPLPSLFRCLSGPHPIVSTKIGTLLKAVWPNKHFRGHLPLLHQPPNHRQGEVPSTIENFGHSSRRADNFLKIFPIESGVFHSRDDCIDRIEIIVGPISALVIIDQDDKDVQAVALGRTGRNRPQAFDLGQRGKMRRFVSDR
jgi:hypothetical protein